MPAHQTEAFSDATKTFSREEEIRAFVYNVIAEHGYHAGIHHLLIAFGNLWRTHWQNPAIAIRGMR